MRRVALLSEPLLKFIEHIMRRAQRGWKEGIKKKVGGATISTILLFYGAAYALYRKSFLCI